MTAAFILCINLFVVATFAIAFGVVASTNPTVKGARWLEAAYGLGVFDVAMEFVLRWWAHPNVAMFAIYTLYMIALSCGVVGIAAHYGVRQPKKTLALIGLGGLMLFPVMLSLPYGTPTRILLYQLPYAALQVLMAWIVLVSGRRMALDRILIVVSGLAAATYLSKPLIAMKIGAARAPQGYLASEYGAISQTLGSITLVALALVLLLVIMRDTTREMLARSETDSLSGVLNRRGFENQAPPLLARARKAGEPMSLVALDLDRFKAINDSFGHAAGDRVISEVADLLGASVAKGDLVARMGGEEFALLLPGRNSAQAHAVAEAIRTAIAEALPSNLGGDFRVSASFGVAELLIHEGLSDVSRRADLALYEAKSAGRNRVASAKRVSPIDTKPCKTMAAR
ncbi:diguanylate cyclase domain-containing protein [Qipengyuania sp.]|uniref:GGDEF domain-containing protein n=1 Tax=Qipengyuania sp. TaxID=2004515 RepID=UPI0035C7E2DC